jgi:undecaprenyl-diphosphatase
MAILELIQSIDESIFRFINHDLSNAFFDHTLVPFRNKYFWVPLYLFLVVSTILRFKKHAYIIILTAVLCVYISDGISSKIIKPSIERVRPCNNSDLVGVYVKAPCRNSHSFVSSHAANHMAVACFFCLLFYSRKKRWPLLLYLWAFLVSIGQVYVGLHYPTDILVGGILGLLIGMLTFLPLKKHYLDVYYDNSVQ